jgi:hypothetical protein
VIFSRDRAGSFPATACWIVVLLPLAVVLSSTALSPSSNWTVRTAVAGFSLLAIYRPDAALLVTAALLEFGIILSHLADVPTLRVTEVLVVSVLAGVCIRALPRGSRFRHELNASISAPVVLLAVAAVASAVVWQRVALFQAGSARAYVGALLQFVTRDYFVDPGDFWQLVSTAVLLEGLALFVVAAALSRMDSTFVERGSRMMILGGAGVAALSVVRLAEIVLRNPGAIATLRATSVGLRISPQIPDYIAAGSYFALCWIVALGMAVASPRRRLAWLAAGLPLIAALYLTGSRSVIAAAFVGLIAMIVVLLKRERSGALRGILAFAIVAVVVMVASYRWMSGRDVAGRMAWDSLTVRFELIRAGLAVIATRPLFGVGLDRFYLLAGAVASPRLHALWQGRMNPHNDFLRIGAELGLIGLGLFLGILVAAGQQIRTALQHTRDALLAGLAGGLVAFLVTSLVSNPLMVRDVSYVFWIALGLAVGRSSSVPLPDRAHATAAPVPRTSSTALRVRYAGALVIGALLVFSIPFRAAREVSTVDPKRVAGYGFFDWDVDAHGTRSRLSGPRATFYVHETARLIEIPMSSTTPSGAVQLVEIQVDGRMIDRTPVGPQWRSVRVLLPPARSNGPRRIDLIVTPSWVPAEVIPGNQDRRVLGVNVGEITVINTQSR